MKKLIFIPLLLFVHCLFAASPSMQQATNMNAYFASNSVTIGNPLTGFKMTAQNSVGLGSGMPFVLWNSYNNYNTNIVFMTNNVGATFNQAYAWLSNSNVYVGLGSTIRYITNRNDFSMTNLAGVGFTNYWATMLSLGGTINQATTNFPFGTWVTALGIPTNTSSWFGTNATWSFQTFGSATNAAGCTNGLSMLAISNGVPFEISSSAGSTSQTWTLLLSGYFQSGVHVTNTWVTNVTIDFGSTSVGAQVTQNVNWSGAGITTNCVVTVTPSPVFNTIVGIWYGTSTNDIVQVKFVPTAVTQDPPSGNYTIKVEQFQ